MRTIHTLIIHCSDTPPHRDIGASTIKEWHTAPPPKGNGWNDIGYHAVIRRDGTLEKGRPFAVPGAHTVGHNKHSLGICLVGGRSEKGGAENNFTEKQFITLQRFIDEARCRYPGITVHGHNEFARRECPSFNVAAWLEHLHPEDQFPEKWRRKTTRPERFFPICEHSEKEEVKA